MLELAERVQDALGDAYRIVRELPAGGMGRLFLATETARARSVVVKVLPPHLTGGLSVERFRRDIAVAGRLRHRHILPVLTAGAHDDLLYYAMPFLAGESLRERLTRVRQLTVADARRLLYEAADALACAHARGVLHGDIKPENIFLEGEHAVLTDFGVAPALVEAMAGPEPPAQPGMVLGTARYMAPEQAAGDYHLDVRTDIYALAIVGYEMLAGQPPSGGPTPETALGGDLAEPHPRLEAARPDIPQKLAAAIAKGLARTPADRFASAAGFRDALGYPVLRVVQHLARTRRWPAVAATVATIAAILAGALVARPNRPALDPNLVAVAPFDLLLPSQELWREGLVDLLARQLDGAGPLRTVPPSVVIRRWNGPADRASASELGRRTGARLALFGTVVGAGEDSVRLTATLLDVANGRVLVEVERYDVASRMDRLADSVSVTVLRHLGEIRPLGAARLASLGSNSPGALKAFLTAEQFYRRTAWDSVLAYGERAIALDTTFALALYRMSQVLSWQRLGADSLLRRYALRAGALTRGLAPRESLLVSAQSLFAAMRGVEPDSVWWVQHRRMFATLEEATSRYPQDPEPWYLLGEARYHFGGWTGVTPEEMLEAFDRAIALDSAFGPAYIHPVQLALNLEGPGPARRYAAAYTTLDPTDVSAEGTALAGHLLDPDEARSRAIQLVVDTLSAGGIVEAWYPLRRWEDSAETALRLARLLNAGRHGANGGSSGADAARIYLAVTLAYRGHLRESRAVGTQLPDLFVELALLGAVPPDSAAFVFSRWLQNGNIGVAALALPWWAARRDTLAIQELARRASQLGRAGGRWVSGISSTYAADAARGYLALVRGDSAAALSAFVALSDTGCIACTLDRLAAVGLLVVARRFSEAARLLDRPLVPIASMPRPSEVLWTLERARVAERLGDRGRALRSYGRVAGLWANADPELRRFVEEARAGRWRVGSPRP